MSVVTSDEVAAIVVGVDLYVRRQDIAIEFVGLSPDAAQYVLRLLASPHEDHALDGVVVILVFLLEAEDS